MRVVLSKAVDGRFKFSDTRHKLLKITAQEVKPLKRSLAQLLALEGQRAELGLDDGLLAIPGNQIALDDASAGQFDGYRGRKYISYADQQESH